MELHQRLLLKARAAAAAALLACLAPPALAASPDAATLGALDGLAARGARVSALFWDLDGDRALAGRDAGVRLAPASLTKVVIASAALSQWPPDHGFETTLLAVSPPSAGRIAGDVILRGGGDATLDETTLWALAAQLRGAGVRQIDGRIVVERAPFGELDCDTVDRCAGLRRTARAYNAAPSAIGVNYGSWCIAARAPAHASRAHVGGCATGELPIPLSGTVQVGNGAALRVERLTEDGSDRIAVSGSIAPGTERQVHRAMSDPAAGAGQILRGILQQTGVTVAGGVETAVQADARAAQVLARVEGLPLQEQVGRMMRYSNNYIADVLTMNLSLARRGRAPRSLAEAATLLGAHVAGTPDDAPAAADGPRIESGSGLTPGNRLSARDLVDVLRRQYRSPRSFPAFYGSFVVPRDAPFEYLRRGNADWLDRVALKTGSLTEPVSVNGIAGYLRGRDGGWIAFAVIVNGSERWRQVPADEALLAARGSVEAMLARW